MIVCEEMQKLRKMLDEKGIEWHDNSEVMSESKEWPMWIYRTHFENIYLSEVEQWDINRMW